MTQVRVNLAALRQPFHPCDPDFIRDVCHAACCRSTTDPTGIAVVVTPGEAVKLRRRGADVDHTTGRLAPVDRRCPFQNTETHLCDIHTTDEPLGCIISPFTVNPNHTLIVRNRYRRLKCFKAPGSVPVAIAHRRSLETLFGPAQTDTIIANLDQDTTLMMHVPERIVVALLHKNQASKPQG